MTPVGPAKVWLTADSEANDYCRYWVALVNTNGSVQLQPLPQTFTIKIWEPSPMK